LFRALLHFSIVAAVAVPAFAQVFKWVDERGVTHYGERPPQGAKASEVQDKLASPPPGRALAPPAQKGEAHASPPSFQAPAPNPPPPSTPAPAPKAPLSPEEAVAAARRANCDKEKAALDLLKRGGMSYSFNEKGERVKIDNSAAITEQERRVGQQCGS